MLADRALGLVGRANITPVLGFGSDAAGAENGFVRKESQCHRRIEAGSSHDRVALLRDWGARRFEAVEHAPELRLRNTRRGSKGQRHNGPSLAKNQRLL